MVQFRSKGLSTPMEARSEDHPTTSKTSYQQEIWSGQNANSFVCLGEKAPVYLEMCKHLQIWLDSKILVKVSTLEQIGRYTYIYVTSSVSII